MRFVKVIGPRCPFHKSHKSQDPGLLWMAVMMFRIALRPLTEHSVSRIFRMALFWHFLDFVWIFIFIVVYGIGYLL